MADPDRMLSSSSDADDLERALLGSLRDVSPPRGVKDETWNAVAAQIAAAGAAGALATATGKAAGASALRALVVNAALGVAVVGSTITGGVIWVRHAQRPQNAPAAPAVANVPAAANAPIRPLSAPAEAPPEAVDRQAPAAGRRVSRPGEGSESPDPLSRESAIVTEARAQLKSGDPRAALATLARLHAGAQNAVLVQEREVLTIQALSALGDTDSARRRARAFVTAYPNSPHTPQLRHIADGP